MSDDTTRWLERADPGEQPESSVSRPRRITPMINATSDLTFGLSIETTSPCPFRKGRFWFQARPQPLGNRRRS